MFKEYEQMFVLDLTAADCIQNTTLARLALQGKMSEARMVVSFPKEGNARLRIDVPKARSRAYDSRIEVGSRKIW